MSNNDSSQLYDIKVDIRKLRESFQDMSKTKSTMAQQLVQINGKVKEHEQAIRKLDRFKTEMETWDEYRKRREEMAAERKGVRVAIISLIVLSVVNLATAIAKIFIG